MSNFHYAKGKEKILSAAINYPSDTIKASLVSTGYTPNASTDEFFNTISAHVLATLTLSSKSVAAGALDAGDLTFPAVASGSTAKAVVLWKDTGTSTTSPLLQYIDQITGFPLATNGGDIAVQWDGGSNKIFSL